MASNIRIICIVVIMSMFNKLAISSDDRDFGRTNTMCTGNSTEGNPLYQKYEDSVSSLLLALALKPPPPIPAFYTTTVGPSNAKAYGSYICWGDFSLELCQKCVHYASEALLKQDIYQECISYGNYLKLDLCLVRYANQSVIEYKEENMKAVGNIGGKVANYLPYNRTLSKTFESLIEEAGLGNWSRANLETRVVPVPGSRDKIHILVQCIPVMSAKNCSRCLREVYGSVPLACKGTEGGIVIHSNCIIKFSNQTFIGGANASLTSGYLHVTWVMLFSIYFVICI